MTISHITTEIRGHVLLIGLNRPKKYNAFSLDMYRDIGRAYKQLESSHELRCGLVFAHGDHFTAGVDLQQWAPAFAAGQFPDLPDDAIDPLGFDPATRVTKPIVMAVHGFCYTIGLEWMLSTDIRVAAANTQFAQIEIKRGIYPVGGGTVRLIQEAGWSNAMRYLLTGDKFSAETAYRIGIVQEVVENGKQFETALGIAETIAAQAPLGVYATLRSARISREQGEPAAMAQLLPDLVPIMKSADAQEGVQSFLERRDAKFEGR